MIALLGRGHEADVVANAVTGVGMVVSALQRAARFTLEAKAADGVLPSTGSYRASLDALRRTLNSAIATRRAAERLIAQAFDASTEPALTLRCDDRVVVVPGPDSAAEVSLRDLMAAADSLLVVIDGARSVLDVPDGTGRCRRALIARAHAAARAADAHAIRAERISASLETPCPDTLAHTRRQAQLAHAEVAHLDDAVQALADDAPLAAERAHRETLLTHVLRAEAFEQVARASSALTGIRYAAERLYADQPDRIDAVRDEAVSLTEACTALCGQITSGRLAIADLLQRRADMTERLEDILLEMLHPTSVDLGTLFGSGPYARPLHLVGTP